MQDTHDMQLYILLHRHILRVELVVLANIHGCFDLSPSLDAITVVF